MPTAEQVCTDGLDLGEVVTLQMKKIEELTLYAIDAKKENELLKKEIAEIKAKLK